MDDLMMLLLCRLFPDRTGGRYGRSSRGSAVELRQERKDPASKSSPDDKSRKDAS